MPIYGGGRGIRTLFPLSLTSVFGHFRSEIEVTGSPCPWAGMRDTLALAAHPKGTGVGAATP
jgi:hypothetical protein